MKTSILIIAHNEEAHIRECIESILHQSMRADEIVLIAHNCTDSTMDIVREYPEIRALEHNTPEKGPVPAREYGFTQVTGDIVACLDGDSYTCPVWFKEIVKPFDENRVYSVSGYPNLVGNWIFSFIFFLQGLPILKRIFPFYFWGSNFACRKSAYDAAGGMKRCREIAENLNLHYPAEDCILSFLLQKDRKIVFVRKARSYVYPGKFFDGKDRGIKQLEDLKKIKRYFGK